MKTTITKTRYTLASLLAAFILFRVLDAWKPWPISRIQNSPHATSIMWDDLAAGVFTNLILQAATRVLLKHGA